MEKSLQMHDWKRYENSHLFSVKWVKILKFLPKPTAWEWYGFPQNISMLWELGHSQTLGIAWVFINSKSVSRAELGVVSIFPYLFCNMGISSSQRLGIVWISASHEIFKKPLTLEYLCFLIFFLYYVKSLFPCSGNCMC